MLRLKGTTDIKKEVNKTRGVVGYLTDATVSEPYSLIIYTHAYQLVDRKIGVLIPSLMIPKA